MNPERYGERDGVEGREVSPFGGSRFALRLLAAGWVSYSRRKLHPPSLVGVQSEGPFSHHLSSSSGSETDIWKTTRIGEKQHE
jgi:hypothetical protein